MRNKNGFTLVEIMVVIAIIGMLAILGTYDYQRLTTRAFYARARQELIGISEVVQGLRIARQLTLLQITGNNCTTCAGNPLASWQRLGYTAQPLDPWGQPYQMDENEGELGPMSCPYDDLWSAGSDRVFDSGGVGDVVLNEDLLIRLPKFYSGDPACLPRPTVELGPAYNF